MLDARARVSAASQITELRARQGGRHGDLTARRLTHHRHTQGPVWIDGHVPIVELLDALHIFSQADQRDFHSVNHCAAPDGHDQIGLSRAQSVAQGDHCIPRGLLHAAVKNAHDLIGNA